MASAGIVFLVIHGRQIHRNMRLSPRIVSRVEVNMLTLVRLQTWTTDQRSLSRDDSKVVMRTYGATCCFVDILHL